MNTKFFYCLRLSDWILVNLENRARALFSEYLIWIPPVSQIAGQQKIDEQTLV